MDQHLYYTIEKRGNQSRKTLEKPQIFSKKQNGNMQNLWTFTEYKNNGLNIVRYSNNCYNHSIILRLIYQF